MFKISIQKISDESAKIVIQVNDSKHTAKLDLDQCLEFSNHLMDAAEDLIKFVNEVSGFELDNEAKPTIKMLN